MTARESLARALEHGLMFDIVDQVGEGVAVFDMDDTLAYANGTLAALHDCSVEDMLGKHLHEFVPMPPPNAELERTVAEDVGDGILRAEIPGQRLDGSHQDVAITVSPLRDEAGEQVGRIALVRDITLRRTLEAQLARAALHDPLTDLPSRRLLSDRLEHALDRAEERGKAVAVVFIDLDGFKAVIDLHGHSAGDDVLRETADRLRACLRQEDTIARMGGDELVVLIEDVSDVDQPVRTARRLLGAMVPPFVVGDSHMTISASIGIAMGTAGPQRALLHAADQAMYTAKRSGPGRIVVTPIGTAEAAASASSGKQDHGA